MLSDEIKIKLILERLYSSKSIEYLGIKISIFLHQYDGIDNTAVNKLNLVILLFLKIRNQNIEKYLFCNIEFHLRYSSIAVSKWNLF